MRIDARHVTNFGTVEDGLTAEMTMLDAVANGNVSRASLAWSTSQCLVVPAQTTRRAGFAGAALRSASDGWPVAPRRTGGGTTPQGDGILNVALAFRMEEGARLGDAYAAICDPIVDTMRAYGLNASVGPRKGAFCDGAYNVLIDGRKTVGTAQRWRRLRSGSGQAVLAHALILLGCDASKVTTAVADFERGMRTGFEPMPAAHISVSDVIGQNEARRFIDDLIARLRTAQSNKEIGVTARRSGAAQGMTCIEEDGRRERMAS